MTREHAKNIKDIFNAFAEGETIQYKDREKGVKEWNDLNNPDFNCKPECYRIKPEGKLMTHKQLAEWCAMGNGQFTYKNTNSYYNEFAYASQDDNSCVDDVLIRRWNSDRWVKPTVDIYLEDCRKKDDE